MDAPAIELRIKNFRGLRDFVWAPSGLCLLCGANGAGKTTTLDALIFLQALFDQGLEKALLTVGGQLLGHLDAKSDEPVEFTLRVRDVQWVLRFPIGAMSLRGGFGEELRHGDELKADPTMLGDPWSVSGIRAHADRVHTLAKMIWDRGTAEWMRPLVDVLTSVRVHPPFELSELKKPLLVETRDSRLARDGSNLWSVLHTWHAAPSRYQRQFDRVMEKTRRALPGLFASLEFDRGLPTFYRPHDTDPDKGINPKHMADGLLSALLVLTGLIGAPPGSIVAFDEVESRLHPHAIRSLLATMREEVEARGLTVILTTHSPVVMNEFRDTPEQVFVLEPSPDHPTVPNALSVLHAEAWLAQAKLGTLYDQLAFAAPPVQVE